MLNFLYFQVFLVDICKIEISKMAAFLQLRKLVKSSLD